jgi:hypothetical protein
MYRLIVMRLGEGRKGKGLNANIAVRVEGREVAGQGLTIFDICIEMTSWTLSKDGIETFVIAIPKLRRRETGGGVVVLKRYSVGMWESRFWWTLVVCNSKGMSVEYK